MLEVAEVGSLPETNEETTQVMDGMALMWAADKADRPTERAGCTELQRALKWA